MSDPQTRLAETALRLLAKTGWSELTLMQIARAAKMDPAGLQAVAPNKPALLGLLLRWIGREAAKGYRRDAASEDARDRLLDVALTWFEALAPHRAAVRALYDGLKWDPLTLLAARTDIVGAGEWLMSLAEADGGPALPARALALAGIVARAIPIWVEDDTEMTRTMARLDGDLRRTDSIFGRLRNGRDADTKQPPRSTAAAAGTTARSGKTTRKAGTPRRSRARNPARRPS